MNKKKILKAYGLQLAKNTSFKPVFISNMVLQLKHALNTIEEETEKRYTRKEVNEIMAIAWNAQEGK